MNPWKPARVSLKPFGPEYDVDRIVESKTGGMRYTVNLHRYTCSCPDFVQRRSERPIGDLGRSCKHLRDTVLALDIDAFGDELTRVIFKSPHGPYDRIWFAPGPEGEIVALGIIGEKEWLNLFLKDGPNESYARYGYNPKEDRWAYDSAPRSAEKLLELVSKVPGLAI